MGTGGKQSGFKVGGRTAVVEFEEGSPWHGVEATVRISLPFEALFWFQEHADERADPATVKEMLQKFGDDYLVSWNLEDDAGKPYPATGEGALQVADQGVVTALMMGWIEAVAHPAAPLSVPSDGIDTSVEEPLAELANASAPQPS